MSVCTLTPSECIPGTRVRLPLTHHDNGIDEGAARTCSTDAIPYNTNTPPVRMTTRLQKQHAANSSNSWIHTTSREMPDGVPVRGLNPTFKCTYSHEGSASRTMYFFRAVVWTVEVFAPTARVVCHLVPPEEWNSSAPARKSAWPSSTHSHLRLWTHGPHGRLGSSETSRPRTPRITSSPRSDDRKGMRPPSPHNPFTVLFVQATQARNPAAPDATGAAGPVPIAVQEWAVETQRRRVPLFG